MDVNNLTIDDVMSIREQLCLRNKDSNLSYGEKQVFVEIIMGTYFKYKENKVDIIKEDIEFLNKG